MHHFFSSQATQWECDYLNISSVLRNYLDITHSVQFDQKLIIKNMRENGIGKLKVHKTILNVLES